MKLFSAFLRLVRWPNLVFIALTQALFYYCVIIPSLPGIGFRFTNRFFLLIVIASILIAAAGYIINDYFDIDIDQVNKPEKMIIEKIISRRWAIALHLIFTTIGVAISLYVALQLNRLLFLGNVLSTLLLWSYSTTFKKKLLSGNIIISLLTAWTILVLYVAIKAPSNPAIDLAVRHVYKFAALYAGFAFIISLVREVVKDMEDMQGDAKYGCHTMPIVWGVPVSKVFAGVWLIVLVAALAIIQFYTLQLGWWPSAAYCFLFIVLPLLWILKKLYAAQTQQHYHQLSTAIKLVMLAGILSMVFLKIYS